MARFTFDGCDTVELAKTYGTPLYVLSGRMIRENLRELRSVFLDRWPGSSAAYAGKALQTLDLLRILASEGMGLDAVSGGELYAASRAGFPMERVLFHGNNKSGAELRLALELGVGRVVVDNPDEMALLDAIAGESGRRVPVLARVTPGVDSHTHRHISTGQLDSKFGMGLRPELYMFGLLIGSCLGGNLTPFGASANVVAVGMLKKRGTVVRFGEWLKVAGPFTILTTLASSLFIWAVWR